MIYYKCFLSTIIILTTSFISFSQIKGRISSHNGQAIQSATVSILNTYNATSINMYGEFELKHSKEKSCTLLFKSIGYKPKKVNWDSKTSEVFLSIVLEPQDLEIEEVIIKTTYKPADRIIKNAIAQKNKNSKIFDKYEADFYSKGSMTLLSLPKTILGQKIDSTEIKKETAGSDILYLSETISQIKVEKPNKMFERIIASKVSGDNKGLSFNRANDADFDLYKDYISLNNTNLISPISDQAFSYYTYQFVNSFEDENQTIHKIKINAKRDSEPVLDGYLYIVDESWQIYAADIYTLGRRANFPIIDTLVIKQQYTYNQNDKHWVKQFQALEVKAGILGIKFKGNFTHTISNYNFSPIFDHNTFSKVITEFNDQANENNEEFWNLNRQVPLTDIELKDYMIKDSVALVKSNPTYIDSVDRARSHFKLQDIVASYHYQNTPKKFSIDYKSPLNRGGISFNTIQGWNLKADIKAKLGDEYTQKKTQASLGFNYGFSDNKLYTLVQIKHQFNKNNYAQITLSGGNKIQQFNTDEPIVPFLNTLSSLFFKENFIKAYAQKFIAANYSQYLHPDFRINANLNYQNRSNLYNTTNYSFFDKQKTYSSNNPLDPNNTHTDAFIKNNIVIGSISLDIFFKTKIEKKSNEIIYIHNIKYPKLTFNYRNALYSSVKDYKYQEANATIQQSLTFDNKGLFGYRVNGGIFINADKIAFTDYKHFNGNRTHIATTNRYLNEFLILPYYSHSTNKSYVELHTEHNFQGYILNKIPLISRAKLNTIIGYHLLANDTKKPYHEFTVGLGNIGWGKYRFLRVDYVYTKNGNLNPNGIVVGISLLNMFR